MSRKRRQTLSPSLFPFLAVLVCTLGTLILMLALVATGATSKNKQDVDHDAQVQQRVAQQKSVEQAKQLAAEAEFRLEQLVAFRDAQTADAELKRNELTHLEQHTEEIRQQLTRLNAEVEAALDQTAKLADAPDVDAIRDQVAQRKQRLAELEQRRQQIRRRVVIVPHRGPNGTLRRPIYLECGPDGLTIWPEAIKLSTEQLLLAASHPDAVDANPLDVALRTARLHAMQSYGDAEPPYPMLVVRPDGIDAYVAARAAMSDWDDQYGYELVDAEVELAFPPSDPVLAKSLENVIANASAAQRRLQQILIAGGNGRGGNRGGNAARPSFPSAGRAPRVISAADLTRRGGMTGFRPDNEFRVQRGATSLPPGDPLADIIGDDLQDRFSGADATSSFAPRSTGSALDQRDGGTALDALAQLHEAGGQPGQPESGEFPGFQTAPDFIGQAASASDQTDGTAARANQVAGQFTSDGQPAGADAADSSNTQTGQNASPRSAAAPSGGESLPGADEAPLRDPQEPRPEDGQFASGQTTPSQGQSDQGQPSQDPQGENPSNPNSNQQSIDRQGDGWALPSNLRRGGTNVLIRSMSMEITNDTIRLGGKTIVIDPRNPSDANRQVVLLARETMQRWGPAIAGGRWQPRLTATVSPDGQFRSAQLARYLQRSGIEFVQRNQTARRPTSSPQ